MHHKGVHVTHNNFSEQLSTSLSCSFLCFRMGNTADAGSDNIMFRCARSASKDELWHQKACELIKLIAIILSDKKFLLVTIRWVTCSNGTMAEVSIVIKNFSRPVFSLSFIMKIFHVIFECRVTEFEYEDNKLVTACIFYSNTV